MQHLLAYTVATGGSVTDLDMTAAVDPAISQRNGHYILTEDYNLLAAFSVGATITRVNVQIPTFNAVTRFNVWPVNRSVDVLTNPQLDFWGNYPPPLPKNEEITVKVTDTASEQATVFLWISTPDWNQNVPRGIMPVPVFECRFTSTVVPNINAWSALSAITFEQSLRGGVYAVIGMEMIGAHKLAYRMVFPRQKLYQGRQLRPGSIYMNAIGDVPLQLDSKQHMVWGQWGYFSTFEPPQLEHFSNDTVTLTNAEGRMWLVRISEDMNVPV